ncbi:transglycosylase domain-containing protein [Falsarthrobacter nasiphocae]|uniref:Membrane peptidoglycan carboxypeptidase n=1 Tax=Falsarthrobacter nasiphocae TaxID=189863 RepID=A0AAE3YHK2_9MICC|nr:transglycosylase domain-containing protein [Falsarthrobacter nasiphocae]MDR6892340.1 membrane peptidoglycan carboxypeptidase [Falsarthrobacter nasiphocae]
MNTATTLGKFMAFLLVSVLCGVLTAGLLVPLAAATGTGASKSIEFFDNLPAEFSPQKLSQASQIQASDGTVIAEMYSENRVPVKLDQVSKNMTGALLAIEDDRFYDHGGVDPKGIAAALFSNSTSGTSRGASTLTQQYVTNVLNDIRISNGEAPTYNGSKTVLDKLQEIRLAVSVEKKMSKDEILEGYLNVVQFNGRAYGIEAASQYFFNKSAKDLSLTEGALLAGVVNGPSVYDPVAHPEAATKRRNIVLGRMLTTKRITKAQYDAAVKEPLNLRITPRSQGCYGAKMAPYFCQWVTYQFLADPAYGKTRAERQKLLNRGGLVIKTTLDSRLQKSAQEAIEATASTKQSDPNVGHAAVTVQPGTGRVLAMAQNTTLGAGAENETGVSSLNFNVDKYIGGDPGNPGGGAGGFQPGSTYKPFTFSQWLAEGHSMNEVVDASRKTYEVGDQTFKGSCFAGGAYTILDQWSPQNYGNQNYGNYSALYGLALSLNTVTFATAAKLDICKIQELAMKMGVHPGDSQSLNKDDLTHSPPSALLGTANIAPITMANAFATWNNDGKLCKNLVFDSITGPDGTKYPVPSQHCEQAIPTDVAHGTLYAQQQVMKNGSGRGRQLDYPSAAKTGTNDFRSQTWFIGSTQGLTTAVWLGNFNEASTSLADLIINGKKDPELDGSGLAGTTWQTYMKQAAPHYPHGDFPSPPENMVNDPRWPSLGKDRIQ